MKNLKMAEQIPAEESFDDLFLEDEDAEPIAKIEAGKHSLQEKEMDENFKKVIIDYVYNNIFLVTSGQKQDHSLADINPECQEIIDALSVFEQLEGAGSNKNLFAFLQEYDKLKGGLKIKQNLDEKKLDQIATLLAENNYDSRYMRLAVIIDILSEIINKDVIKDMLVRHNLEYKATELTKKIMGSQIESGLYAKLTGELNNFMDTYGSLVKIKNEFHDQSKLLELKKELNLIINLELGHLQNQEYEYAKLSPVQLEKYRIRLEQMKRAEPIEVFDVDNYGFIGLILEKRLEQFTKYQDDYKRINERIDQYSPS